MRRCFMANQLDLRLNSIKGRPIASQAKVTGNDLDGQAKAVGSLFAEALRHAGMTQQEASFRMGYADASKLASWISGDNVASLLTKFLSIPELRRGFLRAIAETSGVTVQTVVTIPAERAAS